MSQPPKRARLATTSVRISFDAVFNNLRKLLNNIENEHFIVGPKVDLKGYLWQIRLHKINKNIEVVLVYLGPHEKCVAQFELEFEPNLGFGKESFEQYTYAPNKTSEYMSIFEVDKIPDSLVVKVNMDIIEEREVPTAPTQHPNQQLQQHHRPESHPPASSAAAHSDAGGSPKSETMMQRLHREQSFADCTLRVGGKTIAAHRFVLSYGSRVFAKMFKSEAGAEGAASEIVVTDCTVDLFDLFLRYLYTQQCDAAALTVHCAGLLDLAAKYQVEGLVNVCINHMISHQGIHTATDILISAEAHGLTSVKAAVIQFIVANMKRMTKETDMLTRLDTKLKDEIIKAI